MMPLLQTHHPSLLLPPSPRPLSSSFRTPLPSSRLSAPPRPSTSPFLFATRASPPSAADFALISIGLLSIYWVGNFVLPELILKKVISPEEDEVNDAIREESGKRKDDEKRAIYYGLVGGAEETELDSDSVNSKLVDKGTGFGNISKNYAKGRKRKS